MIGTLDELRKELAEYKRARFSREAQPPGDAWFELVVNNMADIAIADVIDRMESRRFELRSIINRCEIKQPQWEDYDPQPHIDELKRHEQATKEPSH